MRTLSDIDEILDRSIETAIRNVAVAAGYTPDRSTYNTLELYNTELTNIKIANGFALEVYGPSSPKQKLELKVPRIVIEAGVWTSGDLGGDTTAKYNDLGAVFEKVRPAPMSANLRYYISLVSNDIKHDRILKAIMSAALPNREYVPFYNDSETKFLVVYQNAVNKPDMGEGLIEKTYLYEAMDLYEVTEEIIQASVVKINEIKVDDTNGNNIITENGQ